MGLRLEDLHRLTVGQVIGIIVEVGNDDYKYKTFANQSDIAKF